jgi:hypothetical protein
MPHNPLQRTQDPRLEYRANPLYSIALQAWPHKLCGGHLSRTKILTIVLHQMCFGSAIPTSKMKHV